MTKIGLKDDSDLKEKIVKIDDKRAIRYRIVEEAIDLGALRQEKEGLEAQLNMPEPTTEELIELGKGMHPFYNYAQKTWAQERIKQIDEILGE